MTTEDLLLPWEKHAVSAGAKDAHAATTSDRTGGAIDVLTMDLYALEELVRSWGERPFRA